MNKKWQWALAVSIGAFFLLLLWWLLSPRGGLWFEQEWVLILILGIAAFVLSVLWKKKSERQGKLMLIVAGFMGIIVGGLQVPYAMLGYFGAVMELSIAVGIRSTMMALCAYFAIVGGVNHLRRTKWPLAMAGSIAVFLCFVLYSYPVLLHWSWSDIHTHIVVLLILGIVPIVLTVLSKKEFE